MENFTSSCDTYVTVCGHIFHNTCLNSWMDRGEASCPSCRNPCRHATVSTGIHKIYFQFDPDYEPKIKKLTDEIAVLKMQLRNAQQRRVPNNDSDDEEHEFDLDVAKAENMQLMEENETLHKIIDLTEADLKEKREIIYAMNTILDELEQNAANQNRSRAPSSIREFNIGLVEVDRAEDSVQNQVDRLKNDLVRFQNVDLNKNKIIITGVRFEDIGSSAKDYVVSLAIAGDLSMDGNDIFSVDLQQPKVQRDDTCLIFVVFKTFETKQKFLALKPTFPKNLNVMEALNKEALALFNQAKSLKRCGYKQVYHSNGKVFVKKNNDSPPIIIQSFNHVKELRSGSNKSDDLATRFHHFSFME